nr:small G protein signaling modulator 1-like [Ipomoea trifida]
MSFDRGGKQWKCGKGGTVNFQRVSSIVRDIGEPCLHQSPIKIKKMLKPDRWQATFDSDGKIHNFQKVLKLIIFGGVDPSIRPEVWEFLLGCYALSSTTEYRMQLRTARRERYRDLEKLCQKMHSSIGTGTLAFVVGSKVMDMRTCSRGDGRRETEVENAQSFNVDTNKLASYSDQDNNFTNTSNAGEIFSDPGDLVSVRRSTEDGAACDSFSSLPTPGPYSCSSPIVDSEAHGSEYVTGNDFDFPPLPVTDLFEKNSKNKKLYRSHDSRYTRRKLRYGDERMHSFSIKNNADLVIESNVTQSYDSLPSLKSEIEIVCPDVTDSISPSKKVEHKMEIYDRIRISDAPDTADMNVTTSEGGAFDEERVSEWLWTLHRIVVDVVRTDSHLEFYGDTKNLARMSDILAVYAWVDPATGYCQGMSDLLSPFVVLFEDNADAFWCFEMLIRRTRDNFQMEGPTGVMKQLQTLWHILEFTDREMFSHLSNIGAESLHFAFRMLLVLFRRELSFDESLCLWEMMWAADFKKSMPCNLKNCPELLVIQIPKELDVELGEESVDNKSKYSNESPAKHGNVEHTISENTGMKSPLAHPFCGLTRNFWSKTEHIQNSAAVSSMWSGDDELPVFCVAAILVMNRQKIIKETRSIDDMIKIFNDNAIKIRVKRCVRTAIKLRKKYYFKLIKSRSSPVAQNGD